VENGCPGPDLVEKPHRHGGADKTRVGENPVRTRQTFKARRHSGTRRGLQVAAAGQQEKKLLPQSSAGIQGAKKKGRNGRHTSPRLSAHTI